MRSILYPLSLVVLFGCPSDPDATDPTDPVGCQVLTADDVRDGAALAGCYTVAEDLTIEGDVTIAAGSRFEMDPDTQIDVQSSGSVVAEGTEAEPVVFTGEGSSADTWMGIAFNGAGSPSNRLAHVRIEGACSGQWNGSGASVGAVFVDDSTRLALENLTIDACSGKGVNIFESAARVTMANFTTTATVNIPVTLYAEQAGELSGVFDLQGADATVHISGGGIDNPTSWSALDYTVEATIIVAEDLTLAAGSVLNFEQNVGLDVNGGSLNAQGTAAAPIVLQGTDAVAGYWLGIHFENTNSADNVLDHVTIDGAGSDTWHGGDYSKGGIYAEGDEVRFTMSNSVITNAEGPGLVLDGADPQGKIAISSTTVSNCDEGALVSADATGALAADLVFTGNTENRVRVGRPAVGGDSISETVVWPAREVPYFIDDTVYVEQSGSLTIEPGATVIFDDDQGLAVGSWPTPGGTLVIGAAVGDEVLLTGDSAVSGFWKGLYYNDSASGNVVQNTRIEYAGSSGWNGATESQAGMYIYNNASVEVLDTTFANNLLTDIYVDADATLTGCTGLVGTVITDVNAIACTVL